MISLRPAQRAHVRPLGRLSVAQEQADLVSPNLVTLAEAPFEPGAHVWGVWRRGAPVGLAAMIDPRGRRPEPADDPEAAYLWRLMVDARFQGLGLGGATIRAVMAIARDWGLPRLTAHVADEPHSALPFYERFGFRLTGRRIGGPGEEELEIAAEL